MAKCLQVFANIMKWFIFTIYISYGHIFLCFAGILVLLFESMDDYIFQIIALVPGQMTAPGVAVYVMNQIFEIYDEIQSWQIACIVWGVSCGFVRVAGEVCYHCSIFGDGNRSKFLDQDE